MDAFMYLRVQEDIKEKLIFLERLKIKVFAENYSDIMEAQMMIKIMMLVIQKLLPLEKKEKFRELIAKDLLMSLSKFCLEMWINLD